MSLFLVACQSDGGVDTDAHTEVKDAMAVDYAQLPQPVGETMLRDAVAVGAVHRRQGFADDAPTPIDNDGVHAALMQSLRDSQLLFSEKVLREEQVKAKSARMRYRLDVELISTREQRRLADYSVTATIAYQLYGADNCLRYRATFATPYTYDSRDAMFHVVARERAYEGAISSNFAEIIRALYRFDPAAVVPQAGCSDAEQRRMGMPD